MVTFAVALSADAKLSAGVALAMVLHNIPEGYLVAVPIYAATRSRLKALLWVTVAVLFEVIAGITVYAVVETSGSFDPTSHDFKRAMAVLSSIAAGVMVYVAVVDMLPLSTRLGDAAGEAVWHRGDGEDLRLLRHRAHSEAHVGFEYEQGGLHGNVPGSAARLGPAASSAAHVFWILG